MVPRSADLLQRQSWARELSGGVTSELPPKVTRELVARRVDKTERAGLAAGVRDSEGVTLQGEGTGDLTGFPTAGRQGQTQDLQVYLSSKWGMVEWGRQEATWSQTRGSGPDQSSSRERKLDLGLTDDLMVMEPDDQVQVKARTCLGGCPGPEPSAWYLGMRWWQAEDGSPGRSQAGDGERACEFGSIKVRVPEDISVERTLLLAIWSELRIDANIILQQRGGRGLVRKGACGRPRTHDSLGDGKDGRGQEGA